MQGNFQQLINTETPVLVDFFATWCGPCKALTPHLEQLKERMGDEVCIVKIDVDKNPALAAQFRVSGVPTLMLFRHGKTLWRQSGVLTAGQLEQIIKKLKVENGPPRG